MTRNKSNLLLYTINSFVSTLGGSIQYFAILLYIMDVTEGGLMIAAFGVATTATRLLILPFSGVIGDRFNRKKIMIATDLINGLITITMAGMACFNMLGVGYIIVAQILLTVFGMVFRGATRAILPELVSNDDLIKANGMVNICTNFSEIVGPVIGAVLYGIWGIKIVFFINGLSFVFSGISECFIKYSRVHRKSEKNVNTKIILKEIKEGVSFIGKNKKLWNICIFYLISSSIMIPLLSVGMPYVFREVVIVSNHQFSLLEAAYVLGMAIGSLLLSTILAKAKSKKLISRGLILEVTVIVLLTVSVHPNIMNYFGKGSWLMVIIFGSILIMGGIADVTWDVPIESKMQLIIPNELRSRVLSSTQLIFGLGIPIVQSLWGILLGKVQVFYILLLMGGIYIITIAVFLIKTKMESDIVEGVEVN